MFTNDIFTHSNRPARDALQIEYFFKFLFLYVQSLHKSIENKPTEKKNNLWLLIWITADCPLNLYLNWLLFRKVSSLFYLKGTCVDRHFGPDQLVVNCNCGKTKSTKNVVKRGRSLSLLWTQKLNRTIWGLAFDVDMCRNCLPSSLTSCFSATFWTHRLNGIWCCPLPTQWNTFVANWIL